MQYNYSIFLLYCYNKNWTSSLSVKLVLLPFFWKSKTGKVTFQSLRKTIHWNFWTISTILWRTTTKRTHSLGQPGQPTMERCFDISHKRTNWKEDIVTIAVWCVWDLWGLELMLNIIGKLSTESSFASDICDWITLNYCEMWFLEGVNEYSCYVTFMNGVASIWISRLRENDPT